MTEEQQRINTIISDRYNNYAGTLFAPMKKVHEYIQHRFGDSEFLNYLEAVIIANPKPVYQIPTEFYASK